MTFDRHTATQGLFDMITGRCLCTLRLWMELRLSVLRKKVTEGALDSERVLLLERSEEDKRSEHSEMHINDAKYSCMNMAKKYKILNIFANHK